MKLKLLDFVEHAGLPSQWQFEGLSIRQRNLIVGVNASGKSRILKSIDILASLLSKRSQVSACPHPLKWEAHFAGENGEAYVYELELNNFAVVSEKFLRSGVALLDRPAAGPATIHMESGTAPEKKIEFKIPEGELAAPTKMDLIQTPFLQPLIEWGKSVFFYRFGSSLGQEIFGIRGNKPANFEQIEHDQNSAIPKFAMLTDKFGGEFLTSLKTDMERLGYPVAEASIGPSAILVNAPVNFVSIFVKEVDLDAPTEQMGMSQGMYRVFSILIHVHYLVLFKKGGCVLIDDIGEGLDFERSGILIDILTEKSEAGGFQLVMSTNDRFIMNHVPLTDWTLVKRLKGIAKVFNYSNSKEKFDDFRFTGFSNFDFLKMDFLQDTHAEGGKTE